MLLLFNEIKELNTFQKNINFLLIYFFKTIIYS